jgi:hypothetical protein
MWCHWWPRLPIRPSFEPITATAARRGGQPPRDQGGGAPESAIRAG